MKAFVTGGNGFIGRRLVNLLAAQGYSVSVLTRHPNADFPSEIELVVGDLSVDGVSDHFPLSACDVIFHCAGEIKNVALMRGLHVDGTRRLLKLVCRAAEDRGKSFHWVHLSSVGAYGPSQGGANAARVVTESTPDAPVGEYEVTKAESDRLVAEAAKSGALTFSILRPSNIYGPTMTNQSVFQLIKMIDRGFFFFIGEAGASANYIHVDNVVDALMLCGGASPSREGVFNLSDHCTLEAFVAVIADELGCPPPTVRVPERLVRWFSQAFGAIPGFPLTSSRINAMTTRSVYSIQKIQEELGYIHRISMEDGIRQFVRAWKQSQ